jgi:hypothetical protein
VYRYPRDFDERDFEHVVLRELDWRMPRLFCAPDAVTFVYEEPEAFSPETSDRVLIDNPWAPPDNRDEKSG